MMIHHLDGIECFYPSHTNSITSICLQYCMEKNLLITCGSDYHGNFEKTMIGELNVSEELLNLKGIVWLMNSIKHKESKTIKII